MSLALSFAHERGLLPHFYDGLCCQMISLPLVDEKLVNTTTSKGSLFIVPLLREPLLHQPMIKKRQWVVAEGDAGLTATEQFYALAS